MSKFNIMKKMDEAIFAKCKEFKDTAHYQKASELLSTAPEEFLPIIKFGLFLSLIIIPLFILIIIAYQNSNTRTRIAQKNSVIQMAKDIKTYTRKLNESKNSVSTNLPSNSQSGFKTKLQTHISNAKTMEKISLADTNIADISTQLSRINLTLKASKVNTREITQIMNALSNNMKASISSFKINKIKENKSLDGEFEISLLNSTN